MSSNVAESFSLDERYVREGEPILISGIQMWTRLLLEQAASDRARGLHTAGFVSGYRGSPLGVLDQELWRQADKLHEADIRFQPGINEDLAATAVWGSQQVGLFPGARYDGVYGLWYGKAPGLDRSGDAIRHANVAGTSPCGGVLLVVGDDHACKSSTLPSHSEYALKDLAVPILNPSNVQDQLQFGLFGWEMSRYTGLWTGMLAVADTMDSLQTVHVPAERQVWKTPGGGLDVHIRLGDTPQVLERRLVELKIPAAIEFQRANPINVHISRPPRARIGIVTTGLAYLEVREALARFGLGSGAAMEAAGIALWKLGMVWPLDRDALRDFAARCDQVLVVENKRAFVEREFKAVLYGSAHSVPVSGKQDQNGATLLDEHGEIDAWDVGRAVVRLVPDMPGRAWLEHEPSAVQGAGSTSEDRKPLFCPGCPHNTSTRVPQGSRATAGIGCHYMAQWMDRQTQTYTHMGGEGVTWVGLSPFTDEQHIFVNLGDGTYFHSGSLAIRQAVAAGVNATYKILLNGVVAMTGGQSYDGELRLADVVRQVQAENVREIVVVSDDPQASDAQLKGLGLQARPRAEMDAIQQRLRQQPGVTVIVYQQACATELRRQRKKGLAAQATQQVFINPEVCEGCGDCTAVSSCAAIEPVPGPLGVKRAINQTACNQDLSCTDGFCPSFVLVEPAGEREATPAPVWELEALKAELPLPTLTEREEVNVLLAGVGGTGIVTLSALIATAAHIDGLSASTLDMTGLAQKGGAVFSHVRLHTGAEVARSPRIPKASTHVLIGADLVTASTRESLEFLGADTLALVNTDVQPTAEFVLHGESDSRVEQRLARLTERCTTLRGFAAGGACDALLGDRLGVNVMLLGMAWQQGALPLSLQAIERAITVNGVAVQSNLTAFHLGRARVARPELLEGGSDAEPAQVAEAQVAEAQVAEAQVAEAQVAEAQVADSLEALVSERCALLSSYQDDALATRYRNDVEAFAEQLHKTVPDSTDTLARVVAASYAHLLAYKDEYEVARLHLSPEFAESLRQRFGRDARVQYLLAPPLLGKKKRRFGSWMRWGYRLLAPMKRLRGTPLDVFGYLPERREERALIAEYRETMAFVAEHVTQANVAVAHDLLALPDRIRGYGHVKSARISEARAAAETLRQRLRSPVQPVRFVEVR